MLKLHLSKHLHKVAVPVYNLFRRHKKMSANNYLSMFYGFGKKVKKTKFRSLTYCFFTKFKLGISFIVLLIKLN